MHGLLGIAPITCSDLIEGSTMIFFQLLAEGLHFVAYVSIAIIAYFVESELCPSYAVLAVAACIHLLILGIRWYLRKPE
jgi:hypothetical protein